MKKYYIMCLVPIGNLFVAKIWNYRCVKNKVPMKTQVLRGLIAAACFVPIVIIIGLMSTFFQNKNIYYSLLYFAPAILNLVTVWLGRKDTTVANTDTMGE